MAIRPVGFPSDWLYVASLFAALFVEVAAVLARIFRPAKSAMQSGKASTQVWMLQFEPSSARRPDPLIGWTTTADTDGQIRMRFATREEAIDFATRHAIAFEVTDNPAPKKIIKAYADNFAFGRRQPWTH